MIRDGGIPEDIYRRHSFTDHLLIDSGNKPYKAFSALLESLVDDVFLIVDRLLESNTEP